MIRIEALPADILGLNGMQRAALSGKLKGLGVATAENDIAAYEDPFLPDEREQLARWLEACATAHAPHVAVLESIRKLAQPGSACVLFEARPALLMGPCEQLFGALQTIALARQLSSSQRAVVPVLWLLGDEAYDADLIQSRVLNRSQELQTVQLEEIAGGRKSADDIELSAERHGTGALRAVLSQLYGDFPHIDDALELFTPKPGETLPQAFTRAMYELLGPQGLIIVRPIEFREDLTRAAADKLSTDLLAALLEREQELSVQYGHEPDGDRPWFYRVDARGRQALFAAEDGFHYAQEPGSRTPAELAAELVQAPSEWQIGSCFQALARASILPILVEVGGARELQRHLLLRPARTRADWPSPSFVARVHISLVDGTFDDSLKRLEVDLASTLRSRGKWLPRAEVGQAELILQAIADIKNDTREALARQKMPLRQLDPRLSSALRSANQGISKALEQLVTKIDHLRADGGGKRLRHERRLSNGLFPDGEPQESRLPAFLWVACHGRPWLTELLLELDPFSPEHLAVHLP